MEKQKTPLQKIQKSAEHIADIYAEIAWAFADSVEVALKGIKKVTKSRRTRR